MKPWNTLACLLILATAAVADEEKAVLLTPPPGPAPKINGPKVYACGPNHPFLYRIPATGRRPMQFTAEGLPAGLTLDADAGILRGAIAEKGEYRVTLRAKNAQGQAERPLKIVCGDTLALTPPMGWNSWYIHYNRVTRSPSPRGGPADDRLGHGRLRLSIRQHRRLLDEEAGRQALPRRPGGGAAECQVPRHPREWSTRFMPPG